LTDLKLVGNIITATKEGVLEVVKMTDVLLIGVRMLDNRLLIDKSIKF
jgi:hypothetical protein